MKETLTMTAKELRILSIPDGLKATGVILSDQVKSLDWRTRKASLLCTLPETTVQNVLGKLGTLLENHE